MREFQVTKDDGTRWIMRYTSKGVRWLRRNEEASSKARGSATPPVAPVPNMGWGTGGAAVSLVTSVIDATARVGMMLEQRQMNMLEAAAHDERRLMWLADMLSSWSDVHSQGQGLDLTISNYLARESRETLESIAQSRGGKAGIPQALLYEVDCVTNVFRSGRETLYAQFEALKGHPDIDLRSAIRHAMPGRNIDWALVENLGSDRTQRWEVSIRDKQAQKFDADLAESFRYPDMFLERLFPSYEVEIATPMHDLVPAHRDGVLARIVALLRSALPSKAEFLAIPNERLDAYRELALLPAEVARTRTLHAAWVAVTELLEAETGRLLLIAWDDQKPHLALVDSEELQTILGATPNPAIEAPQRMIPRSRSAHRVGC